MVYWLTGGVLLVYLVLVWFIGTWANPPGAGIWFLRIGLWLIGLFGAGFAAWWFHRQAKAAEGTDTEFIPSAATGEVDLLVRDAVRRLKKSALGRGASLGNLPLIFLVGDPGSTKTTTIIHSALDPELLAGHVYQDNTVVPTRVANFWYTRQAVFVDGGGSIFSQPEVWKRLIRLVQPGRVASAGKKHQAPRAAVVCFDYENFLRQGANEATLSAARRLGTRLNEVSQLLGISFPIYVLFTRADRIGARQDGGSLFLDYVAGLSKDETSQVLGATLPVRSLQATGVYAEEETRRLEKAFDELFYSLSDKRIDLLSIAGQTEKLPGIYEFPRELRKRRDLLVQFLVDLARPSQLSVNPFLRGFYFSGVRPVVIEDVASALPEMQAQDTGFNANATVVFGAGGMRAQAPVESYRASSRKVPEWVFLSQLFNEVLLKDRVALSASGFSSRVSLLRRIAFATLAGVALVFAIGFLVSFIGNFSLERDVKQATEVVRRIRATPGQIPSIDQLQTLDRLRQQLEEITSYRNGESYWHLRWGLYAGNDIYDQAREVYFDGFKALLFDDTEKRLQTALLPTKAKPDPSDSYLLRYNDLRAYLITAGYGKYSTEDFLFPILYKHWDEDRKPDADTLRLVMGQFQFYSTELAIKDPYRISPDHTAVNRARDFLLAFTGIDVPYFNLLAQAQAPAARDINFRNLFPNSVGVVDAHDTIKAAFTPEGFALIDAAINRPDRQKNEDWVLGGNSAVTDLDPTLLRQRLKERYESDYIQQWRDFLDHSHAHVSQNNAGEAAGKLEILTSASSPLLELLWFISHNTKVSDSTISDVFAPVQAVVSPTPEKGLPTVLKSAATDPYTKALSDLREALSLLAKSTGTSDPSGALKAGEAARTAADILAGNKVDEKYHIPNSLGRLLKEPIQDAEIAAGGTGKVPLNNAGKLFCQQFEPFRNYFPFNSNGQDLPIERLNAVLAPNTGALSALTASLAQYVIKQGSHYVANNSGSIRIYPDFVRFFNYAAEMSNTLYAGNPTPRVAYSLKQVDTNMEQLAIKIGSQAPLTGNGPPQSFVWTGASEDVAVTTKGVVVEGDSGPWGAFHFFRNGNPQSKGTGAYDLSFVYKQSNGSAVTVNGQKQFWTYQLQFSGANPLPLFVSNVGCVSQVAH
jgi:type VI secretion system protein ImpL